MSLWVKIVTGLALAAAVAVAGIAANLYLLGVGGSDADPVGRLTPRSGLSTTSTPTPPAGQPTTTDDDRGHDGGHDGDGDDD